ncbi:unnamed protein product [Medioppia subpectinata]|uniref:non-specific serine/threonine protein kinase n=1 Tax=Medioppia subpectinata TaxID=1979941 RepID=A0A7R9KGH8_9ACAR|nr:unnamed protein product [Medioppia subpectinata]CAG2102972.1 unnamed protein product [Medioppia subpectinata]
MIKHDPDAGTFVKLGGFGLATEHLNDDQSHTECSGVDEYLAPEVRQGRRYDTKCDMYSLGVTVQHMFNFDANTLFQTEQELDTNYEKIKKLTLRLLNNVRNGRPSAKDLIIRHNEWSIPYASVRAHVLAIIEPNASYDIDRQFAQYFLNQPICKVSYFIMLNMVEEILAGLIYLHNKGIMHRDVKESNILIRNEGDGWVIKICDFDLAKLEESASKHTIGCGTDSYRAPELRHGDLSLFAFTN